jgi:tetratricopeptide (TPR) repeat protein
MPSGKVRLTVDAKKCVENGIVPRELADQIVPYIEWEIKQIALFKNDLMVLDFLATSDWSRSIYIANPSSLSEILNIDQYFHQEGMVYKFMPVKSANYYQGIGGVNAEKSYEIFMNSTWGNLNKPGITVDRESDRNCRLPRQNYLRAAETFMLKGDNQKAIDLLDKCLEDFPDNKIQFDMLMIPFAELYYNVDAIDKGNIVAGRLIEIYADDLRYYKIVKPSFVQMHYKETVDRTIRMLRSIGQMTREYKQEHLASKADEAIRMYTGN